MFQCDGDLLITELLPQRFTVYKVVVSVEGRTWFIFRRYNEFATLHDKARFGENWDKKVFKAAIFQDGSRIVMILSIE